MRHPFLRSAGSELKDPNFKNVTLLLHGDGTNGGQNNTFVDSGPNNLPITRTGVPTQGTFSPYGDNWSNYFDGSGDFLSIPSNAAFAYGTSDFTVECWVYKLTSATMAVLDSNTGSPGTFGFEISSTQITGYQTWGTAFTFTHTLALHSWQHIAFVRTSGTLYLYVNGAQIGSTAASQNFVSSQPLIVGRNAGSGADQYNGYISNLRIVKGTAVYTAAFTPPTAPLTAITNTSLLTCQSNRFRDASTNNFTITRNGDVSVQRFSPFSPTAAYAAGTIGGSGYFPTTSNSSITVSSSTVNIDTNPFTVESWIYYGGGGIRTWYNPASGLPFHVNGTTLRCYHSGGFIAAGPIEVNAWTHIAVTRDASNILRVFLNGVLSNSGTVTGAYNSTTPIIGDRAGLGQPFLGYIAGFRLLIGTALYTSTFTPPTSPPTSIADTRWLVNFTNAAILDNAMMAVPETVGNAQISTSVKKYGTGSLYFNGTTNLATNGYIKAGIGQLANLSSGDFTIECWFYGMNNSLTDTESSLFQQGEHDWRLMFRRLSGQLVLRYAVASVEQISTAGNLFSLNTWNHVAVCKSGTTTTLYLNGVSVGTTTASPANSANFVYVGANLVGTSVYWPLNGYIDDLRITKGVARYTANFTPPTAPFPNL